MGDVIDLEPAPPKLNYESLANLGALQSLMGNLDQSDGSTTILIIFM